MWISRVRVTGGFLEGLDVTFSRHLNVIIGGRGAGKTTLLELMRYALDLSYADADRSDRQGAYIRQILGSGEVVIDLDAGSGPERLVVDASAETRTRRFSQTALMVSQNEIESIASNGESRLRLIDLRANIALDTQPDTSAAQALTIRMADIRSALAESSEQLKKLPATSDELKAAMQRESVLIQQSGAAAKARAEEVRVIDLRLGELRTQELAGTQASSYLRLVGDALKTVRERLSAVPTLTLSDLGLRGEFESLVATTTQSTNDSIARIDAFATAAENYRLRLQEEAQGERVKAEPARTELATNEKELAQISLEVSTLRRELSRLSEIQDGAASLSRQLAVAAESRDELLRHREVAETDRFDSRTAVADGVNANLGNSATIVVEQFADTNTFRQVLLSGLKNSGLQYSAVVEALAANYLPSTLLRAIETGQISELSKTLGLAPERTERLIYALDQREILQGLAAVSLGDTADFMLRDGKNLKSVSELSTGQKCAVTLPILLTDFSRSLLLDQPEDHLDNAYLVSNVIQAINTRTGHDAQTIVATHNANIPVLGSADVVIALGSDGTRGYVTQIGPYDSPPVVQAITNLMEGGAEAFRQRARFYKTHGVPL